MGGTVFWNADWFPELLLGGVTRNWLSKPTIPLLLAQ